MKSVFTLESHKRPSANLFMLHTFMYERVIKHFLSVYSAPLELPEVSKERQVEKEYVALFSLPTLLGFGTRGMKHV